MTNRIQAYEVELLHFQVILNIFWKLTNVLPPQKDTCNGMSLIYLDWREFSVLPWPGLNWRQITSKNSIYDQVTSKNS